MLFAYHAFIDQLFKSGKSNVLLFLLFWCTFTGQAQEACLLVPTPLSQRIEQATIILEGKVVAQQSFWDAQHQNIYTTNRIEVYKIFKGTLALVTEAEIITEGGTVGNKSHVFSATLALQPGEQGIFFLEPSRLTAANPVLAGRPVYSVYSSRQGFIRYELPHHTASDPFRNYKNITTELYPALLAFPQLHLKTVQENTDLKKSELNSSPAPNPAARTFGVPAISGFAPDSLTAGTGAILTISGQNFGSARGSGFVEFKNANDGGSSYIKPLNSDYIFWSDNTIRVRVPSLTEGSSGVAGTGQIRVTNSDPQTVTSTASLTVIFAVTNVLKEGIAYQPYHTNENENGGYTLQFADNVSALARSSFMRSMQTWSCYTAINWQAETSTATVTTLADDNINLVRFAGSTDLPVNVLGRTISRYEGCQIGDTYSYRVSEFDFEFNNRITWQFGPALATAQQYDFETVTLHELGHAHQLGHITQSRAVMHYSIARGQVTRNLSGRNDIDGGLQVVRRSFQSNPCGPTRMEPLISTDCNLPSYLLSFTATLQTNGTTQVTWSLPDETNIAYYNLQKSTNGTNWYTLAKVNAINTRSYAAVDANPAPGFTYYRLQIVNTDNQYSYSPVRRVGTETALATGIRLFPNPTQQNNLYFEYSASTDGKIIIKIYDYIGRSYILLARNVTQGNNPLNFDVAPLPNGFYILQVIQGQEARTVKFLKQ